MCLRVVFCLSRVARPPSQSYGKLPEGDFPYPIISDPSRELAVQLGMVDPIEKDKAGLPLTCRAVSPRPLSRPLLPAVAGP